MRSVRLSSREGKKDIRSQQRLRDSSRTSKTRSRPQRSICLDSKAVVCQLEFEIRPDVRLHPISRVLTRIRGCKSRSDECNRRLGCTLAVVVHQHMTAGKCLFEGLTGHDAVGCGGVSQGVVRNWMWPIIVGLQADHPTAGRSIFLCFSACLCGGLGASLLLAVMHDGLIIRLGIYKSTSRDP